MGNYHGWSLAQNQKSHINDPIPLGAIGGDNATPFYINFPQLPAGMQWVFPFVYGFLYPLPVPLYGPLYYDTSTQPAGAQAPPTSSALAQITAYRADPGVSFSFAAGTPSIAATISRWQLNASPGIGSQASATRAAAPGVTHIGDSWIVRMLQSAAATTLSGGVGIIDGPSGGSPFLLFTVLGGTATTGSADAERLGPGLTLRGTPGRAMTIEFSAGIAGFAQSVSMTGYDQ